MGIDDPGQYPTGPSGQSRTELKAEGKFGGQWWRMISTANGDAVQNRPPYLLQGLPRPDISVVCTQST
jgi:hypothetical protein